MFTKQNKVICADALKIEMPIGQETARFIAKETDTLKKIILGEDKRFLVVCGPCSADDADAIVEYCRKLSVLKEKYSDKVYILPRVFTAKPRTTGDGYLGMMYQPDGVNVNIDRGLRMCRKTMLRVTEECKTIIADELLYPEYYEYFDDLVSYYFIGARSSENPEHRNVASGLDVPVGVKNSTGGNILALAGSVHACLAPKEFLLRDFQVKTNGNQYAHAVLRGYVDESGVFYGNYSANTIDAYESICESLKINNKFVMVDCSHANSMKQTQKQIKAAREVINAKHCAVRGIMLESYLFEGCGSGYGYSKTDACISFNDTSILLEELYCSLE
ncbi:MAG: 3-deoxy-7-phosphoheptulonate synthase [Clostridia bacterium]|nr:3-deoxy-7-phosphoheptulonate synthase [Clostridia bacterium]